MSTYIITLYQQPLMIKAIRKIQFKLKNPKSEIEEAIYLSQQYSKIVRQLHVAVQPDNKQPLLRRLQTTQTQLLKIAQNLEKELRLYAGYQSQKLEQFKNQKNIPRAACLISSLEQKQNEINNIKSQNKMKAELINEKLSKNNIDKNIQELQKKLIEQKNKRVGHQNKINRIKLQLEEQAKQLVKQKTTNFESQMQMFMYKANQENFKKLIVKIQFQPINDQIEKTMIEWQ